MEYPIHTEGMNKQKYFYKWKKITLINDYMNIEKDKYVFEKYSYQYKSEKIYPINDWIKNMLINK